MMALTHVIMTVTYIAAAVVLLGLCIFVHELGHLLGGKMVGIKAKTFSLGYGNGFIKKKIGDTTYQITLIPFGGYCSFYGEDPSEERKNEGYEFLSASPLRRMLTVVMGPVFNLLFGILIFFFMNLSGYPSETNRIVIPDYFKTGDYISPAHAAGIKSGDTVVNINGKTIRSFSDIQNEIVFSGGKPLTVAVLRSGEVIPYSITPKKYSAKGYYTIGVVPYGDRILVGKVVKDGAASAAGLETYDEIKALNGIPVKTPVEFVNTIRSSADKKVVLTIVRTGKEHIITLTPRVKEQLTITSFEDPRFPGEKNEIVMDNIDIIKSAIKNKKLKINGALVSDFDAFERTIAASLGRTITIENQGGVYKGIAKFERFGYIGVEPGIAPQMITVQAGFGEAFSRSLADPYNFIVLNLKGMGMLFSGKLDVRENLSGPIRIMQIAGDTAYYRGIAAFIILMAKISIILMVMNLLPLPAVDGSYIIFFTYELIIGRPLKQNVMEKIQMFGFAFLIILSVLVVFNDLTHIEFLQNLFK